MINVSVAGIVASVSVTDCKAVAGVQRTVTVQRLSARRRIYGCLDGKRRLEDNTATNDALVSGDDRAARLTFTDACDRVQRRRVYVYT